jgi:hypothetical protein
MGPYRTPPTETSEGPASDPTSDDRILGLVLLVLGAARVIVGIAEHEIFGAEATGAMLMLAFAIVLLIPRRRS